MQHIAWTARSSLMKLMNEVRAKQYSMLSFEANHISLHITELKPFHIRVQGRASPKASCTPHLTNYQISLMSTTELPVPPPEWLAIVLPLVKAVLGKSLPCYASVMISVAYLLRYINVH